MPDIERVTARLAKIGVRMEPAQLNPRKTCILLYGPEGSGKSRLAASAAAIEELQPVVALDFEGSMSVVDGMYSPEVFQVVQLRNWAEVFPTLNLFSNTANHPFKTVIVDPINAAQGMMQTRMRELQDMKRKMDAGLFQPDGDLARLLNAVAAGEKTNNSLGEANLTMADYDVIGAIMLKILESLALAPVLTIFTAHSAVVKSPTGAQEIGPHMKGNESRVSLGRLPSITGYMEMYPRENKPTVPGIRFDTHKNNRGQLVKAKDRFDCLPPMLAPTMADIWEKLNQSKNSTS